MSNNDFVKQLNKTFYGTYSLFDTLKKAKNFYINSLCEWISVRTCKHEYTQLEGSIDCNHVDYDDSVIWTAKAYLHECSKCGKRTATGDLKDLRKGQQDYVVLWIRHEK